MTLLPSAAALHSGTLHDPGSLQLLSGWKTRYSSTCDILEFLHGSSFAPSSGKRKRESANDDSLLLGTSDQEFVSPQVGLEALLQIGSCISAGPSAAVQAVVTAAASDVYLSFGGFLTPVDPHVVFVVVTGSAAAASKHCTAQVCLFLVSSTGFLSVFPGTLVDNRFLELVLSCVGHVLGLRIGRGRAWCDRLVRPLPPSSPHFGYCDDFATGCAARSWWCFWAGAWGLVLLLMRQRRHHGWTWTRPPVLSQRPSTKVKV